MPEHKTGTREEWQATRDELAKLEAEQAERNEEIKRKRFELPWVPVENEYEFDTEDGKRGRRSHRSSSVLPRNSASRTTRKRSRFPPASAASGNVCALAG
jgi:Bacterial protein of unknown function (DUF899)